MVGVLDELVAGKGGDLEVSVDDVKVLLEEGKIPGEVRLIDCREEDEYAICRLPEAKLIPISTFSGLDFEGLLERERPVVIYCHHGMRSAHAALHLRAKGFPLAYSMRGGIECWAVEVDAGMARY